MAASSQFICALGRIIEKVEKIRRGCIVKHDQFPLPAYSIPLIWNTIKGISSLGVVFSLIICYNLREQGGA